ncbi:unnamed protein product, partial [Symbiodinium necroappetens]
VRLLHDHVPSVGGGDLLRPSASFPVARGSALLVVLRRCRNAAGLWLGRALQ